MIFVFTKNKNDFVSICAALITIDDNSYYFIVNIFRRGGSSKLVLYCWYAALQGRLVWTGCRPPWKM